MTNSNGIPRKGEGADNPGHFAARARAANDDITLTEPEAVNPRHDIEAYDAARKKQDDDWYLTTEGIEAQDTSEQERRFAQIADHFEDVARRTANQTDPRDLPGPGETICTAQTGTIYAAAELSVIARHHTDGGSRGPYSIDGLALEATADATINRILDTRDFTAANGTPFRARLVRKGQSWGKSGSLVAKEDMVFFFDRDYPESAPMIGHEYDDREQTERNGQHITNYSISSLRGRDARFGIRLYGDEPKWTIDYKSMTDVMNWLDRRAPLSGNVFDRVSSLDELEDTYMEHRSKIGIADHESLAEVQHEQHAVDVAHATRRRELTRGWNSLP